MRIEKGVKPVQNFFLKAFLIFLLVLTGVSMLAVALLGGIPETVVNLDSMLDTIALTFASVFMLLCLAGLFCIFIKSIRRPVMIIACMAGVLLLICGCLNVAIERLSYTSAKKNDAQRRTCIVTRHFSHSSYNMTIVFPDDGKEVELSETYEYEYYRRLLEGDTCVAYVRTGLFGMDFVTNIECVKRAHAEQFVLKVALMQDGSAAVTEQRKMQVGATGTEGFITFNDMGDIGVTDLKVTDDQGTEYVVEEAWDTQRSREAKKGRCGYNRTSTGVEICWGVGDSGERTYKIQYTLTNLVKAYDDYDGFCHSFYDAGSLPAKSAAVEIRLDSGDSLTTDNAAVWTFGHQGYKQFSEGMIRAYTDAPMSDGNSIIVLLQLNKGVLSPAVKKDASFKETVKRTAFEGSDYNLHDAGLGSETLMARNGGGSTSSLKGDELPAEDDSGPDWPLVAGILAVIGIIAGAVVSKTRDDRKWKKLCREKLAWLDELMGGKSYDEMPYYRDLPIGGNLLMSGAVLGTVETYLNIFDGNRINVKFGTQMLYDAFMLRMIYKKQIRFDYDEVNGTTRKLFRISEPAMPAKGENVLDKMMGDYYRPCGAILDEDLVMPHLSEMAEKYNGYINDAGVEYYLQKMLYDAAGDDHLLQPGELKAYMEKKQMEWRPLATMIYELCRECVAEEHMNREDVMQVVGFLHYLRDFSLVAERNIEETALWKEYLVYASFYGIADQVRKDMEKIAPDVVRLDDMLRPEEFIREFRPLTDELDEVVRMSYLYQTAQEADMIYERRRMLEYERSSGGSGRSSSGGGGGHSGGGGSGIR